MDHRILADNLTFTEGPRWHPTEEKLYFSDFHSHTVYRIDLQGNMETVVTIDDRPSGLGWLANGDLLIVAMVSRRLLRFDGKQTHEVANLSTLAPYHCNDMVVSENGTAYIGNFGCDFENEPLITTNLIKVSPDGSASTVTDELCFPNGAVITDEGRTLVIAETFAARLTAFDIDKAGNLSNRRIWANLESYSPDGICIDRSGGIWVATPGSKCVIRVEGGGKITANIPLEIDSIACALGGANEQYLLLCTSDHLSDNECITHRSARIELIELA